METAGEINRSTWKSGFAARISTLGSTPVKRGRAAHFRPDYSLFFNSVWVNEMIAREFTKSTNPPILGVQLAQ